jgi:CheY-like chemotaxis protein
VVHDDQGPFAADTIFVVDDDSDSRDALSELLKLCGYNVACAENGLAAMDEIGTWRVPPALILLDLAMPVMDGHTFLRRAREDCRINNVPIIITTATPWAHSSGADAILIKPLKPEILLPAVRRFVKPSLSNHGN